MATTRSGVALDIEGIPELRRLFNRAAKTGIPLSLKSVNRDIGLLVIAKAKPLLPKQAGDYANSLRAGNTSWQAVVRAGSASKARHAPIIHWGSAYRPSNPPRPQLAETALGLSDRIQRLYEAGVEGELAKISAD